MPTRSGTMKVNTHPNFNKIGKKIIVQLIKLTAQNSQSGVVKFYFWSGFHLFQCQIHKSKGPKELSLRGDRRLFISKGQVKMANVEEEEDRRSVSFLLYDFLGYTTMHGAGRIIASRQWTRKIFWIISIMATLAVLSWQIYTLYRLYQDRPLSTHVAIAHDTVVNQLMSFLLFFFIARYSVAIKPILNAFISYFVELLYVCLPVFLALLLLFT